ncbi:MAG TPA: hypothetical protein PLP89_07890 [Synergistales bacterium]|nr:hypothetical protein [Synergistales bacterium]HRV71924.1 hypothetical protein [Thermovirgaceae bacterium]
MRKLVWILVIVGLAAGYLVYTGDIRFSKPPEQKTTENLEKERDAIVADLSIRLEQIRKGMEDLKKQASLKTGEGRETLDKKIADLQAEWDEARSRMDRIASSGADQWQSIVESTVSAFDRMKKAYEAAREELSK